MRFAVLLAALVLLLALPQAICKKKKKKKNTEVETKCTLLYQPEPGVGFDHSRRVGMYAISRALDWNCRLVLHKFNLPRQEDEDEEEEEEAEAEGANEDDDEEEEHSWAAFYDYYPWSSFFDTKHLGPAEKTLGLQWVETDDFAQESDGSQLKVDYLVYMLDDSASTEAPPGFEKVDDLWVGPWADGTISAKELTPCNTDKALTLTGGVVALEEACLSDIVENADDHVTVAFLNLRSSLQMAYAQKQYKKIRFFLRWRNEHHRTALEFLKEVGAPKKKSLAVLWQREPSYAVFGGEGMEEQCIVDASGAETCEEVPAGADAQAFTAKVQEVLDKHGAEVLVFHADSSHVEEAEIAYWMRTLPLVRYAQPKADCFPRCAGLDHQNVQAAATALAVGQILCARSDVFYATMKGATSDSVMEERMFGKQSKESTFNLLDVGVDESEELE